MSGNSGAAPRKQQSEDVYYVCQVVNGSIVVHSQADSQDGGERVAATCSGFVLKGTRKGGED